jgi:hypothetical protein
VTTAASIAAKKMAAVTRCGFADLSGFVPFCLLTIESVLIFRPSIIHWLVRQYSDVPQSAKFHPDRLAG